MHALLFTHFKTDQLARTSRLLPISLLFPYTVCKLCIATHISHYSPIPLFALQASPGGQFAQLKFVRISPSKANRADAVEPPWMQPTAAGNGYGTGSRECEELDGFRRRAQDRCEGVPPFLRGALPPACQKPRHPPKLKEERNEISEQRGRKEGSETQHVLWCRHEEKPSVPMRRANPSHV